MEDKWYTVWYYRWLPNKKTDEVQIQELWAHEKQVPKYVNLFNREVNKETMTQIVLYRFKDGFNPKNLDTNRNFWTKYTKKYGQVASEEGVVYNGGVWLRERNDTMGLWLLYQDFGKKRAELLDRVEAIDHRLAAISDKMASLPHYKKEDEE